MRENSTKRKQIFFAVFAAVHSAGGKAFLHILPASGREMRKIPSIADDKDNVIARLTVLGYTMFVSLETSPLERRRG